MNTIKANDAKNMICPIIQTFSGKEQKCKLDKCMFWEWWIYPEWTEENETIIYHNDPNGYCVINRLFAKI